MFLFLFKQKLFLSINAMGILHLLNPDLSLFEKAIDSDQLAQMKPSD